MADRTLPRTDKVWFNSRLFYINGKPLKFYLDGYSHREVYEMTRIIEAFGGKFTEPGKSVIVFSEFDRASSTNQHKFHIKYIYDSIMMDQIQDIAKYALPFIPDGLTNGEKPLSILQSPPSPQVHLERCQLNIESKKFGKTSCELHSGLGCARVRPYPSVAKVEPNVAPTSCRSSRPPSVDNCAKSTASASSDDESDQRISRNNADEMDDLAKFKSKRHNYSEDEERQMVRYIVECRAAHRANNVAIWRQMLMEGAFCGFDRSATSLRKHFHNRLLHRVEKYTDNKKALKEFARLRTKLPNVRVQSKSSKDAEN